MLRKSKVFLTFLYCTRKKKGLIFIIRELKMYGKITKGRNVGDEEKSQKSINNVVNIGCCSRNWNYCFCTC